MNPTRFQRAGAWRKPGVRFSSLQFIPGARQAHFVGMDRRTALRTIRRRDKSGAAVPFSITFCTLDETRDTGGEIRTLRNVVSAGSSWNLERNLSIAVKRADGKAFRNGSPRCPIKIPLILKVNGEKVIG